MFLTDKYTGDLVQILDLEALVSPDREVVLGRDQAGQEEQEPTDYAKDQLLFPSGEPLPKCWVDVHYREPITAARVSSASHAEGI